MLKVRVINVTLCSCIFLLNLTNALETITTLNSSASSYKTLDTSVVYQFNMSISSTIPANSKFIISFSEKFHVGTNSVSDCSASVNNAVVTPTLCSSEITSTNKFVVTFDSIFPIQVAINFIYLKFTINNPYASITQEISFTIQSETNTLIAQGTKFIPYQASTMNNCNMLSENQTTGISNKITFSFTPLKLLLSGSSFQITMPLWFGTSGNEVTPIVCSGVQNVALTTYTCRTFIGSTKQSFIIDNVFSADSAPAGQIQLSIEKLKNPWSLAAFGPVKFELVKGSDVTQQCENIYNTVTLLNQFQSLIFSVNNFGISASNQRVSMLLKVNNPTPKDNTLLIIEFSEQISLSFTGSATTVSANSTHLILSHFTNSDLTSGGNIRFISSFTVITAPSTRTFRITFTTAIVQATVQYKIQSTFKEYQNLAGKIISPNINTNDTSINRNTQYTITFQITNQLISNSFITVQLPDSQLTWNVAQTCTVDVANTVCQVSSITNITVQISGVISAGTTFTLQAKGTNGFAAGETNSLKIHSYYDALYDSLVDEQTTNIVLNLTANNIETASVTPESLTTNAATSYLFEFTLTDQIPMNGFISLQFPSSVSIMSLPTISSASFSSTSCVVSWSNKSVNVTNCFTAASMSNLAVSMKLSSIRNPSSLQPSDSFSIRTYTSDPKLINSIKSNLIVTMTLVENMQNVSIVPANSTVHQITTYTVELKHSISHDTGDYALIDTPMIIPNDIACVVNTGVSDVTCTKQSDNRLRIIYDLTPQQTINLNLNFLQNYDVSQTVVKFNISIYNSMDYAMQNHLMYELSYLTAIIPNTNIIVSKDDQMALNQQSNITLTITTPFTIASTLNVALTSLQIILPSELTLTANSSCSVPIGTCTPSTSSVTIGQPGLLVDGANIVLSKISTSSFSQSSSFSVLYKYDGKNVSIRTSDITVKPFCISPCQRCQNTNTTCLTCLPSPNIAIYYDYSTNQCEQNCSNGTYVDSARICQLCVSPCKFCDDHENCTSCQNSTYLLHENRCIDSCPDKHYNDSINCVSCKSPCDNCLGESNCTSCLTDFYSNFSCVPASQCPTGTFPNTTSSICQSCSSSCQNCSENAQNCTSCSSNYLYFDSQCVSQCPGDRYQDSEKCLNCVLPCANCSSLSFCLSCDTKYIFNGTCLNASECPEGTYPNDTAMACSTCPEKCSACLNLSYCSSCSVTFLFYDNQCYEICPDNSFQNGTKCESCISPCSKCIESANSCTSCESPLFLYEKECNSTCPQGTYPGTGICQKCLSTCLSCLNAVDCTSCSGSLFFNGSQCVSVCADGSYAKISDHTCQACDGICQTCSSNSSSCTSCSPPNLFYQSECKSSCPSQYFNVSNVCQTCSNCASCIAANTCQECNIPYFLTDGLCTQTCPSNSPIPNLVTKQCEFCDLTCFTCSVSITNCTACSNGLFYYNYGCFTQCPTGLISDISTNSCVKSTLEGMVYFPCCITFFIIIIIILYSKFFYPETQIVTIIAACISVCQFISWIIFCNVIYFVQVTLQPSITTIFFYISIITIGSSILTGIGFITAVWVLYGSDYDLLNWKFLQFQNEVSIKVIGFISCFSFRFYRFIYGRLFNRLYFSACYAKGQNLIILTNQLTYVSIFFNAFPMIGITFTTIYLKKSYDQTFFSALDTLILSIICVIFLILDSSKAGKQIFDRIRQHLQIPNNKYDQLNRDSLIYIPPTNFVDRQKAKTNIDKDQQYEYFRHIDCIDNLNKFGHMNKVDAIKKVKTKSLPDHNKLDQLEQFDLDKNSFNLVINDEDMLQIQQRQIQEEKKRKQLQELERKIKEQEQEQRRRREEEEKKKIRKSELMKEDQMERANLQFDDIAAIDKAEGNDKNERSSPLGLLNKFKKADDKPINDKAMKKLNDIAKKNGLDQQFMTKTFGLQKHYNEQKLNSIIDKHNHVNRNAVKQLFSNKSNPQILQELFGKNSNMDAEKLKILMNDPENEKIIQALIGKQGGIISPEIAKQLLSKDTKYSSQFTRNLLLGNVGMDQDKVRKLLKENGNKSNLKALKKIGGQNLQNEQMLGNMLGKQSKLNQDRFENMVNGLSQESLSNVFGNKNHKMNEISAKILNDKKIGINGLDPILQDQQLIEQLAQRLADGDQIVQQNLINLFRNCDNLDPQILKELLQNQDVNQLLQYLLDPYFLSNLCSKGSNTDINLLQQTLKKMKNGNIKQVFQYDHSKNIDYKALSTLFEKNDKSDTNLITKMLDPDLVKDVYNKNTKNPKILQKLVEKGNNFDKDVIAGIYGKNKKNIDQNNTVNDFGIVNEKNQFQSEKGQKLKFNNNDNNMSRTDGGSMGFLNPLQMYKKRNQKAYQPNELDQPEELKSQEQEEQQQQQKQQDIDHQFITRKKPKLKKLKKKINDIRLDAEQIYLQRIQAPHQHQKKSNIRKRVKKVQKNSNLIMDQDNDVFDLNF